MRVYESLRQLLLRPLPLLLLLVVGCVVSVLVGLAAAGTSVALAVVAAGLTRSW